MTRTRQPGRAWSTFGFAVGIAASIAANIAHAFVVPKGAPANWHPQLGAVFTAAFWPSAVVISIEVISRVQWARRWYWTLVRFVGLGVVATIAALISYGHLSALLRFYGEDDLSSALGPLVVDGLMVICSAALLAIGDNARRAVDAAIEIVQPVTEADNEIEPVSATADKPTTVRRPRSDSKAGKVAKTASRMPTAKPAVIAARAGVSETTVRRHLSTAKAASDTSAAERDEDLVPSAGEVINGHEFAEMSV